MKFEESILQKEWESGPTCADVVSSIAFKVAATTKGLSVLQENAHLCSLLNFKLYLYHRLGEAYVQQ